MTKKKPKSQYKKNGRPTKFKLRYCEELIKFVDIEPYGVKDMEITKYDKQGDPIAKIDKTELEANDPPFIKRFADKIGIPWSTFDNWVNPENAKKYPGFMEAYQKAKAIRNSIIVINCLRGLYNSSFGMFTLKNIANWKDRHDITSNDEKLPVQFYIPNRNGDIIDNSEMEA